MATIDLSPLFRSTIGYDRVNRLLESAMAGEASAPSYPPYNIEKLGEDDYRVVVAVAGFREEDIDITVENSTLTIRGKAAEDGDEEVRFLHRGIAGRAFERRFELADHIQAKGAKLENGLLSIDLVREVPEHLRPRKIEIGGQKAIEGKKKAA